MPKNAKNTQASRNRRGTMPFLMEAQGPWRFNVLVRVHFRNSFRIRSYKKCARKCFGICTYEIAGLKVSWNQQLQKMWGVGDTNLLGGIASLANPMGFAVTQPFDSAGRRGELNSGAGGGACWLRKLLRRTYDAVPVEDLCFDGVAGSETHWALGQAEESGGGGGGANQHGALVRKRLDLKTLGCERQAGQDDVVVAGLRFHLAGECGAHHGERDRAAPGHAQQCRTHKFVKAHERRSGIAGQHADRHGVPRREADRFSRAHGDAAEAELRPQLGKRSLHQIALAHRRPAGGNEQIGRVARRLQQTPQHCAIIRRRAAVFGFGAAFAYQRREGECVAVANLAVAGDSSDVHQLVSRAHNTDARPAVDTHLGAANKCQQRQRRWTEDFPALDKKVAAANILSRRKDAAAGMRGRRNHDVFVRALQLLEGDYRVGAARDWRSGCDGHRCIGRQKGFACFRKDFAYNRKPCGIRRRGAGDVGGAQGVPIHGRAGVGYQVCVSNNILGDDTSQGLGQRNLLRRQAPYGGQNDFPRLVKSDHTNGCKARSRARHYNPLRGRGLCVDRWMGYGGGLALCESGSELPRLWRPKLEQPAGCWRYKKSGSELPRSRRPKLERHGGCWRYKSSARAKGLEHHAFRNTQALWRRGRKVALACPSPS